MYPYVLTLVGEGLSDADLDNARDSLRLPAPSVGTTEWLSSGLACDLLFVDLDPQEAERRARACLNGRPIDLAAQPLAGRRKLLLVADMESTIIHNEMLDELAEFVGKRHEVEAITARAMAGALDFAGSVRARVSLLSGLTTEVVTSALERVVINSGARELVATMNSAGAFTALVSGGFGVFAESIQRQLGFHVYRANELQFAEGCLTGDVVEPILGRAAKLEALTEFCHQQGLDAEAVVAVGDGANDLAMLGAAGLGVAYHAKPAVVAAARYSVIHGDLRTLLFFQGYRESEIVG